MKKATKFLLVLTINFLLYGCESTETEVVIPPPIKSKVDYKCGSGAGGLNVVSLKVLDLDKSEKYYTEVLTLEPLPMPDNFKPVARWFKISEGCEFHLSHGRVHFVNSNYLEIKHLRLNTNKGNVKKLKDNATVSKNTITKEILNASGLSTLYLNDPDGYVIEVTETN